MGLEVTNGTSETPQIITPAAMVVVDQLLVTVSQVGIMLMVPTLPMDLLLIAELAMRLELGNFVTILFFAMRLDIYKGDL
jgi:hypothetical protein